MLVTAARACGQVHSSLQTDTLPTSAARSA
jgi:hypothetical protein